MSLLWEKTEIKIYPPYGHVMDLFDPFSDFLKNNTEISPLTCLMKTAITIQTRKYSP